MCGICGVFEYAGRRAADGEVLRRMNGALVHRGPDDEGYHVRGPVGLAMRRLSIIDRSGGHQPILNEDETCAVVFNGEIYNYRHLDEALRRRGHRFRTRADTEVIVHAYEEYGQDFVHHLDGMFACAVLDRRSPRPRLVVARDRFGKKPLYYADVGGALVFASEIKALLSDPRVGVDLDPEALSHYLSLLVVPAPHSIFAKVRKLPAGHVLVCDEHGVAVAPYWPDAVPAESGPQDARAIRVRTKELLFAAVEKRLMSEVPLGAFLSGGIDSGVVVAVMSRLMDEPVQTFSVGFEGPAFMNELPEARQVAAACGTNHHEYLLTPDVVSLLADVVRHTDEPFAISSAIPLYLLSKAARRDVTVVLTGDGGDEMFLGYRRYLYERWVGLYRHLPSAFDPVLAGLGAWVGGHVRGGPGRWASRVTRFVRGARRPVVERRLRWANGFAEAEKVTLLDPLLTAPGAVRPTTEWLAAHVSGNGTDAPYRVQNELDRLVWLPDEMLTKVDRMTMAASLEARCPLLDLDLSRFLASLPPSVSRPGLRANRLKPLLRSIATELLPPAVLRQPKRGFNVPLNEWFRGTARDFVLDTLSKDRLRRRGVFRPEGVHELVTRHMSGAANAGDRLYALLGFELWAESYL